MPIKIYSHIRVNGRLGQISYRSTDQLAAEKGLYVERRVTNRYAVQELCAACDVPFSHECMNDLHVTVMYSTTNTNVPVQAETNRVVAHQLKWEWWPGHNGEGYWVLLIECSDLNASNKRYIDAGCTPTFKDYTPHVTVCTPTDVVSPEKVKTVNSRLAMLPVASIHLGPELIHELE